MKSILLYLSFFMSLAYSQISNSLIVRTLEESDNPYSHSKVRLWISSNSDLNLTIDLSNHYLRYYYVCIDCIESDNLPKLFYQVPQQSNIVVEDCGGAVYSVKIKFPEGSVINQSGKVFLWGIWSGDPYWQLNWNSYGAISFVGASSFFENNRVNIYTSNNVKIFGSIDQNVSNCHEISLSSSSQFSSSSSSANGSGRIEIFSMDQNINSQQQATLRTYLVNPGSENISIPIGSYYRYYFRQPLYNATPWYSTQTLVGPKIDVYWLPGYTAQLEQCNGDLWSIKYTSTKPRVLYGNNRTKIPDVNGNVLDLRLNHESWPAGIVKTDDYSWNSSSIMALNDKMAFFDPDGYLLYGTPPDNFNCKGDLPARIKQPIEPVKPCSLFFKSSAGGITKPSGLLTFDEAPQELQIDAQPDLEHYFTNWKSISSQSQFGEWNKSSTYISTTCGDTIWAEFNPLPYMNGVVSDPCGDISEGSCPESGVSYDWFSHSNTPLDFSDVWIKNDSSSFYFLIRACGNIQVKNQQFIYFDLIDNQGNQFGIDTRIRIEPVNTGDVQKFSSILETYNDLTKKWVLAVHSSGVNLNPLLKMNESPQILPNQLLAEEASVLEFKIPMNHSAQGTIKWWLDGSEDNIGSYDNVNTYYSQLPGKTISIDGNFTDWSNISSSSSIMTSSSSSSIQTVTTGENTFTFAPNESKSFFVKPNIDLSNCQYYSPSLKISVNNTSKQFSMDINAEGLTAQTNYTWYWENVFGSLKPCIQTNGFSVTVKNNLGTSSTIRLFVGAQ